MHVVWQPFRAMASSSDMFCMLDVVVRRRCLVFVASTKHKISLLCSMAIHIKHDKMFCPCRGSRGKILQAFWFSFCILQVIKNWSRGRPGNEAKPRSVC